MSMHDYYRNQIQMLTSPWAYLGNSEVYESKNLNYSVRNILHPRVNGNKVYGFHSLVFI